MNTKSISSTPVNIHSVLCEFLFVQKDLRGTVLQTTFCDLKEELLQGKYRVSWSLETLKSASKAQTWRETWGPWQASTYYAIKIQIRARPCDVSFNSRLQGQESPLTVCISHPTVLSIQKELDKSLGNWDGTRPPDVEGFTSYWRGRLFSLYVGGKGVATQPTGAEICRPHTILKL